VAQELNAWTKIKRRAAEVLVTPSTALTRPISDYTGREDWAMTKPRTSSYVTGSGLAVTNTGQPVAKVTVTSAEVA
jgi:hypothetical protein